MQVTINWKDDDPRVAFLMGHLGIESVESLFTDLIDDNIDVWVDDHSTSNDECHLYDPRAQAPAHPAAIPSRKLEPELRWIPDVEGR